MSANDELIDVLRRYFEQAEWNYSVRCDGQAIESVFDGRSHDLRIVIWPDERDRTVRLYVPVMTVPERSRVSIAEAIVRANCTLMYGQFALDMSDGELQYRASLPVADSELTFDQFMILVRGACAVVDFYDSAFHRVVFGDDLSPAEAIAEVEMAAADQSEM